MGLLAVQWLAGPAGGTKVCWRYSGLLAVACWQYNVLLGCGVRLLQCFNSVVLAH